MGTTEATHYCMGCLSHRDDKHTESYNIQSEALKAVLQVNNVMLCNICTKFVLKSEKFIQNVQRNQKYLENFKNLTDSTRFVTKELVSLSVVSLYSFYLTGDNDDLESPIVTGLSSQTNEVAVKFEPKVELSLEYLGQEFLDEHDYQESPIKEEKHVLENCKEENRQNLDNNSLKQQKVKTEKTKNKTISTNEKILRVKVKKEKLKERQKPQEDPNIQMFKITLEQCMKRRAKIREDPKYKNLYYKCEDCIKGFNFKETYDKHMEAHSKEKGEFVCEICKCRKDTLQKMLAHKRCHHIRYRCRKCGLTRGNRKLVIEHYTTTHMNDACKYKCPHCSKVFNRARNLTKHLAVHEIDKRVQCKYCSKTFVSNAVLKSHIILKHPTTEASGQRVKHYVCKECGAGFVTPCLLKTHMIKHSDKRDFYCVECDKLQCEHCEKRFESPSELDRHMYIHLDSRPYPCDKCEKGYSTSWALTRHKQYTHEGYKDTLKYPCSVCHKIFALNSTRKTHMRIHTGERPYVCSTCGATFAQSGALATHNKLVHLRLTRDGKPKKQAASS
ncbi:zinc finger protein 85 isoform X4 [Bicyclus anynana]|uniref:Zinc finger protein 85 isoform X4 n=1 Tax=Bicyclus anynana TaxID=110368 RepID=A0A6J1N8T5_BICAN|nr:zinc finger protein 85 isoform X4 [Bicyclus anynana]